MLSIDGIGNRKYSDTHLVENPKKVLVALDTFYGVTTLLDGA